MLVKPLYDTVTVDRLEHPYRQLKVISVPAARMEISTKQGAYFKGPSRSDRGFVEV